MSKWRLPRPRGRVLVCTRCSEDRDVMEAAQGAATDEEHRYLDPETYVCGPCLELGGETAAVSEIAA